MVGSEQRAVFLPRLSRCMLLLLVVGDRGLTP